MTLGQTVSKYWLIQVYNDSNSSNGFIYHCARIHIYLLEYYTKIKRTWSSLIQLECQLNEPNILGYSVHVLGHQDEQQQYKIAL